ncbi:MAG: SufE family protein [Flavobacteriales bacterium]|nr:SufE family protein [Flavobacteriales bacterium]
MVGTVGNIERKEQEIIDEFSLFDDWMDKYEHIISLGKELPLIEEGLKTEDLLIKGCQSRVWLHAKLENGKVIFTADSDAIITKGIINLLISVLSNEEPDAIVNADLSFIDQIGLKEHLSPTRSNGLVSMVKQMKLYALAFKTQLNNPS